MIDICSTASRISCLGWTAWEALSALRITCNGSRGWQGAGRKKSLRHGRSQNPLRRHQKRSFPILRPVNGLISKTALLRQRNSCGGSRLFWMTRMQSWMLRDCRKRSLKLRQQNRRWINSSRDGQSWKQSRIRFRKNQNASFDRIIQAQGQMASRVITRIERRKEKSQTRQAGILQLGSGIAVYIQGKSY